nr:MAG TPA: hypothetical protein [Siphoviridae sp. ctZYQ8]
MSGRCYLWSDGLPLFYWHRLQAPLQLALKLCMILITLFLSLLH